MSQKSYQLIIFDWEGTIANSCGDLLPGTKEALDIFKAQAIDMAIATSMSTERLKQLLQESELEGYFSALQTSQMGYPKPDKEMLLEVLGKTGHTAEQSLMVGDSLFDVIMANSAKISAIGVLSGVDTSEKFKIMFPDLTLLGSIADLPAYLNLV